MVIRVILFLLSLIIINTGLFWLVDHYLHINVNNFFVIKSLIVIASLFMLIYHCMHKGFIKNLMLFIIFMTAFGFLMVPIYNVFCDVVGLNGKMDLSVVSAIPEGVDYSREITVEFVVSHNQTMPWEFKPKHTSLIVHPGQLAKTAYFAHNKTKKTMRAQAIPSISPSRVGKYFKKVKCFCFSSQKLGPGESQYLTLYFYIDKDFPKDVSRLTLAYTLFDITKD